MATSLSDHRIKLCRASAPQRRRAVSVARFLVAALGFITATAVQVTAQSCGSDGVFLQVLGSGGPELQDRRASSSYLIWENGVPRVLVDAGGGSALRFGESGAQMSQLDVILFSHFHVDHAGDLPALVKSSWFERRTRPLPIFGPAGNELMPSATELVSGLFGDRGVYHYLSDLFEPGEDGSYKLQPHDVRAESTPVVVERVGNLTISAVGVGHGPIPALAWRVEVGDRSIVFTGDTDGEGEALFRLATKADLFVAHNAVPEGATGVARRLHMPPSVIATIAKKAGVRRVVLSHRMLRTLGREDESLRVIREQYAGPVAFANDLDCFPVSK